MATEISEVTPTTTFCWNTNFEAGIVTLRWFKEFEFMHVCQETNTYVFGPGVIRGAGWNDSDDLLELLWDMKQIDNAALPFGQITFFSYNRNGEFVLEAATDRFKPSIVEQAFRTFGYTDPKLQGSIGTYLTVSEKDQFRLKLKY